MTIDTRALHDRLVASQDAEAVYQIAALVGADPDKPWTVVEAVQRLTERPVAPGASPRTQEMRAIRPAVPQRAE